MSALEKCGGLEYGWPSCEALAQRRGLRRCLADYTQSLAAPETKEGCKLASVLEEFIATCVPMYRVVRANASSSAIVMPILNSLADNPDAGRARGGADSVESRASVTQRQSESTIESASRTGGGSAKTNMFTMSPLCFAVGGTYVDESTPALCGTWALLRLMPCPCLNCPFLHSFEGGERHLAAWRERADVLRKRRRGALQELESLIVAATSTDTASSAKRMDPWDVKPARSYGTGDTAASALSKWLIGRFGIAALNAGSGVLDVAGGDGKLGSKLANAGVRCTVIDPLCYSSHHFKAAKLKPNRFRSEHADGDEDAKYVHIRESFDESFVHRHAELVQHASVIVGLHPDEATNAIVQISLDLRRPFVVVPCCVFARRYPRKLRSGKAVRNTAELIVWLIERSSRTRVAQLPFHGQNKMIYVDDFSEEK